ncbi:MAG: hypothetical protein GTN89_04610 [Acidobacteria bacterium]|nr:hypothetical protein [Acidobacteriota bacterium]NIM60427.1 hypothetical protein [Acidobacteriota bacterium]NIO58602.1 hypothetical protein [Acidobacteriota bacterium]NIQ29654.1 hypothetical protein [Acidobacteriota bacterium]NIQ84371.1 hypothetical protein [Acidobacteriota bacterium]
MDPGVNLLAGWIAILAGVVAGAILGLRFHRESWLGGYASWPRRMLRLGHVSFFGLGFLNIAYALSARALDPQPGLQLPGLLLIAAAILMPATCFTAAFVPAARHAFAVPVFCVFFAVALFLAALVPS